MELLSKGLRKQGEPGWGEMSVYSHPILGIEYKMYFNHRFSESAVSLFQCQQGGEVFVGTWRTGNPLTDERAIRIAEESMVEDDGHSAKLSVEMRIKELLGFANPGQMPVRNWPEIL